MYRTDEERNEAGKNDPIMRFKREHVAEGVMDEEKYGRIEKQVKAEKGEVVHYCENDCMEPDPVGIMKEVYSAT